MARSLADAQPAARQGARIELSGPLSEDDTEFISEHVAQGKVFRKHGLVDKAAEQFEAIVARFPGNLEARQELRELYPGLTIVLEAVDEYISLGSVDDAREALREARERYAAHPAWQAKARELRLDEDTPPELAHVLEWVDKCISLGDAREALREARERYAAHPPSQAEERELGLVHPAWQAKALAVARVLEAVDEYISVGHVDYARHALCEARERYAAHPAWQAEARELGLNDEAPKNQAALPPELAHVLEGVDKCISLCFLGDAREALREARERYAAHPAWQAKARELRLDEDTPPELALVLKGVDKCISLGDAHEALREARERYAAHPAWRAKARELRLDEDTPPELALVLKWVDKCISLGDAREALREAREWHAAHPASQAKARELGLVHPAWQAKSLAMARVLEAVDEYISLGCVDDARHALREARERYAAHPAWQAEARELGLNDEAPKNQPALRLSSGGARHIRGR